MCSIAKGRGRHINKTSQGSKPSISINGHVGPGRKRPLIGRLFVLCRRFFSGCFQRKEHSDVPVQSCQGRLTSQNHWWGENSRAQRALSPSCSILQHRSDGLQESSLSLGKCTLRPGVKKKTWKAAIRLDLAAGRRRERAGALNTCPSVGKTWNCSFARFKLTRPCCTCFNCSTI